MEALILFSIAGCFLCAYRAAAGPTIPDRMVAIDIFGILVVSICALLAVLFDRAFLIDIALAWVLLAFVGTLALAKYLSGRQLDE
jgi:multicomponent Na+:H+ antiporter subunit F